MTPSLDHMLHGADYNPEQWVNYPGTIDDDFRLLRKAHMNSVSIGIFSRADEIALQRALPTVLPHGVSAVVREKEGKRFVFLMNFINTQVDVPIGSETFTDMETGMPVS
jgi:beta-galactosidase GanA